MTITDNGLYLTLVSGTQTKDIFKSLIQHVVTNGNIVWIVYRYYNDKTNMHSIYNNDNANVLHINYSDVTTPGTLTSGADLRAWILATLNNVIYTDGAGTPSKGVLILGTDGTNPQALSCNTDGELKINLETSDIEIGAVEIKNAATDDRVIVTAANTARAVGDMTLLTQIVDDAAGVLKTSVIETAVSALNTAPSLSSSTAYETNRVAKASAGTLFAIWGYNSLTSTQFIQVHNTTTLPADTVVPILVFKVASEDNFYFDIGGSFGISFTTGITICNSSTAPTKTIGAADCWFNVSYK